MNWFVYALISMLFFSGMVLLFKKVLVLGIKPSVLMLFLSMSLAIFYAIHVGVTKTSPKINIFGLVLIIIAAFLSYVANLLYTKSVAIAPNPGYSATIISLQLILITIVSIFLFGSEFDLTKGLGIVFAVIAAVLLAL